MEEAITKAQGLIEAMAYIRKFRGKIVVVKLGGSVLDDECLQKKLLTDVAFMSTVGMRHDNRSRRRQGDHPRDERGGPGAGLGPGQTLYRRADAEDSRTYAGAQRK